MSVEGMWQFQTGSVQEPTVLRWGGIVILETGRVFGGDSVMAYTGSYEVDGDTLVATIHSWSWNNDIGDVSNVFGMQPPIDHIVYMRGDRNGDEIKGYIAAQSDPELQLPVRMQKIANLP